MRNDKCATASIATPRWFGYALQSLVYLAHHVENDVRCPSGEIANKVSTEATLMRRILARLAKANIVEAREGRDGGYYLRKSPESITLAEVYRALEMSEPLCTGMMDTANGVIGTDIKDAFGTIMRETEQMMMEFLEKKTIADLVHKVYAECKEREQVVIES
ncbi:RrF2 family transcriptional regulator [Cohnella thailandensis]|jgi:Predicted transcriptional regulator|uniref:Rrf2 family transcriptional regulator n=1 Tax=Cohnella thailandensis TaxID=557557 RepID=A0A841T134_9BACL|nr:Rrf2 family transcriptional regulator [Cohnella thailandensis]MBB6637252.1 Rrf2 family transcriptional regulator [Cohnella thailandensis]MBP1976927.1 Rrf2 family protein [Cohnella thailandensis]